MPDTLTIRVYNVRFGDAILVTIPDKDPKTGKTALRRILIDVGNAPRVAGTGEGGDDTVLGPVIADILDELNGDALDLYVMTHEHLDHVQGLFYAATKLPDLRFKERFKVNYVWLTASSAPDYYDNFPEARKQKIAHELMYRRLSKFVGDNPLMASHGLLELLANNDPTKTRQCVEFIRSLNTARTKYVFRGMPMRGTHPLKEAKLALWAPEEDTSAYYGRFQGLDKGLVPMPDASADENLAGAAIPPAGVDVGAFLRLVESRRSGIADNLLTIDKAANNTSIVFTLEWRGWRLLFSGDAEERSWKTMAREGVLKPVHFLKVAHHGSHNGTPADDIFEAILPAQAPDRRKRRAAISTWTDTYAGIPHTPTNSRLKSRTTLHSTLDDPDKLFIDLKFQG
jgi:hypothetical protein